MDHIIQCPDLDVNKTFLTAFADMGIWLSKTTTKEIETAVTDLVLEYRQDINIQETGDDNDSESINDNICQAMERQRTINPNHLCVASYARIPSGCQTQPKTMPNAFQNSNKGWNPLEQITIFLLHQIKL